MEHGFKGTSVEGRVGIVHVAHPYQLNPVPLIKPKILGI